VIVRCDAYCCCLLRTAQFAHVSALHCFTYLCTPLFVDSVTALLLCSADDNTPVFDSDGDNEPEAKSESEVSA
jgi:hypothetical protein